MIEIKDENNMGKRPLYEKSSISYLPADSKDAVKSLQTTSIQH